MARRSWKNSGVQKFVDGGMPQYGGQYVRESPEVEAQKRGLMQTQMGMPQQGPQPPPFLGQRMPSPVQTMAIPSSAYEPSWLAERRQAQANTGSQMPPQGSTLPYERMPSLAPRATRPQMSPPGMPTQGMPPQGMPPQGMRPQRASMPAQQTQPQMPNMDKYMQMVQKRQQDMAQRGMSPQDLPDARTLSQMPTDQVRQVLGQTVLGPQGMQQLQQQAAKAGGIRPTEMQYLRNPMQAAQQAMGMQQRPAPQASMGQQAMGMQQPQQNMSRAMSGAAMPRVGGFAEGGMAEIDRRMSDLDRYLRDPNLKMIRTKSGLFQFVPINAPKKAAPKAAPKPAAKPAAKAAPKPAANRAAANAVPGARGKQKTGGGSIPSINRPLSAFTGSKTKPVKPTGMTKSTPLPRDMTGVNQTPIRGRDIAGSMAKGAATGLAMGMGPGALRGGKALLEKGIDKGLRAARKPLTENRMSATLARARPGEVVPRLPSSAPAGMGSKTARIPKPKATEYKAPAPKAGAAKRAAEALKRREVTAEEAMDMMKGYKRGGMPSKKAPRGMHYMPNGKLMKNSAHKKGRK